MEVALSALKWLFVLGYPHNIVVFSLSAAELTAHAIHVLTLLRDVFPTLNLYNFFSFPETMDHFDQFISIRYLETTFHMTDNIKGFDRPQNFTE